MKTLLQIFILVDVFFIGVLASNAIRHWFDHLRHHDQPKAPDQPQGELPPAVKEQLLHESQANFEAALNRSANQLLQDLDTTSKQINNLVGHMGTEIVSAELENYRQELAQLRKQAETDISGIKAEIAKHEAEIKAKLAEEMAVEKQKLMQQLDTKLGDAVASFLIETMQHNVDLGTQTAYITAMLEEHKAEFVKEVSDETPAAK